MLAKFVYVLAAALIGASPVVAQDAQAPAGSELAEPYDPFTSDDEVQAPAAPTEEPDLFEVPRPSILSGEESPEPTMLEPDAGVQPLDIPESRVTPVTPDLDIDENMLRGSPVEIPTREQVVPTPDSTRNQVPGVTN